MTQPNTRFKKGRPFRGRKLAESDRKAIFYFIQHRVPYESIAQTFNISTRTIARVRATFE